MAGGHRNALAAHGWPEEPGSWPNPTCTDLHISVSWQLTLHAHALMNLKSFVAAAERWLFLHRAWVLGLLAAVTVVFGMFALKLHLEAGYEKQIPLGHEYVEVLHRYAKDLPGTNRLSFVVKARQDRKSVV